MGQVFEAQDLALDRRVAVKAAWPDIPSWAIHQEARALAAIRHEALPTVHGIGIHRRTDFIVMERIFGLSLEDHLRQRQQVDESFGVEEVLWLAQKIAEGLAVVHMAGIAHRDVKPANVMLTPDRRVVLMDFGLMLPEVVMRFQQDIAGSPAYMAPEAIDNDLAPGAGKLLDVYGLGVTLYELLTGQLPFDAETIDAIREQQKRGAPDIRSLRPDVGDAFASLLEQMLSPSPHDRPESAESLVWQIRDLLHRKGPTPKGLLRVLVVDDDPAISKLLEMVVRGALDRVEVTTVNDGETALKLLRKSPPDAMLLDIHMPRVNGVEVCMYMRGAGIARDTAIIAVSAGAQDEDRQLLYHLGIREFITKGRDLRAQVMTALGRAFPGRLKDPPIRR
jgi:serine/threonine protein kinase